MRRQHGAKYAKATENELILSFYCCDDVAFNELWECRLKTWLKKFVASKVKNREDVEDITQEVAIGLVETKHKPSARFDPQKGNLRSWVVKIAINEIVNYLRKRNQESLFSELTESSEYTQVETPNTLKMMPVSEFDIEDRTIIRDAVRRLGEPSRTIIKLYFWDELTQEEISKEIGKSVATVNRWLNSDLARLRDMLAEKFGQNLR